MSTLINKSDYVLVDFRVCCNHTATKKDCGRTATLLREKFNNIRDIYATKPFGKTEDMCVIGTAMIKKSLRTKFQQDLKKAGTGSSIKIKKAIVTFPRE